MKQRLFWLSTLVIVSQLDVSVANAAATPRAGMADSRVRWVNYNPEQVYRLNGVYHAVSQVLFGAGESIVNVALGNSVGWEVAPTENILFIKPRVDAGPTNLIVTTKSGSEVRNYQFELTVRKGHAGVGSNAMFQVRFRYPEQERVLAAAQAQRSAIFAAALVEAHAVKLALDGAVMQGKRNLRYVVAGSSELAPSEVTDNGLFTVMRFPRNQAIPAIYTVLPDGSESLVPLDVRDDFVVIHKIARQFRLRRGKTVACIWNNAVDTYGRDTSSGTASPDVTRQTEGPSR
jgi:type IV secretion system protein VirB9